MNWPPDVFTNVGARAATGAVGTASSADLQNLDVPASPVEPDEMPVNRSSASTAVDVIEEAATSGFGFVLDRKRSPRTQAATRRSTCWSAHR